MLLRLLALPVTAPIKGTLWVIDQIVAAAEAELGDSSARDAVEEARAAHARGEIDDDEFAARMDELLGELIAHRDTDRLRE